MEIFDEITISNRILCTKYCRGKLLPKQKLKQKKIYAFTVTKFEFQGFESFKSMLLQHCMYAGQSLQL